MFLVVRLAMSHRCRGPAAGAAAWPRGAEARAAYHSQAALAAAAGRPLHGDRRRVQFCLVISIAITYNMPVLHLHRIPARPHGRRTFQQGSSLQVPTAFGVSDLTVQQGLSTLRLSMRARHVAGHCRRRRCGGRAAAVHLRLLVWLLSGAGSLRGRSGASSLF